MIGLKIVILPIISIFIYQVWTEFKKTRLGIFWFLFWSTAWLSVVIIVFYSRITTVIANLLGIERGIDTIIYFSIVALFYLVFRIYIKIEQLNRKISKLAQKEALKETPV